MRQLDLFQDSPGTIALNVLREAVLARNAPGAGVALERLLNLDPGHERASDAGTLIAVLEAPAPEGPDEGIEWLHALEREWRPAAIRLLGTGDGRGFLAPVWRCIGAALGPRPFDPVHPERHASWAYRQGQDWENLKRSVLGVPEHEMMPVLLARLAEAEYRLGDRTRAIGHWFELCWRAPAVLRGLVEEPGFPDADVAAAWGAAQDQDVEPELSPEWFPAWMLLQEPSLAAGLAPCGENHGPRRAFDVVRDLLTDRANNAHRLALRRELKTLHPALLTGYLDRFAGNRLAALRTPECVLVSQQLEAEPGTPRFSGPRLSFGRHGLHRANPARRLRTSTAWCCTSTLSQIDRLDGQKPIVSVPAT